MDDQKRIKFTTKVLPDGDESARIGFNFGDVLFCEISGDGDKVSRLFTDILATETFGELKREALIGVSPQEIADAMREGGFPLDEIAEFERTAGVSS